MKTAELKEFIDRIKFDLSFIKECNNSMTDRNFGCEEGVLISGNEAEFLVLLLSNFTTLHPSIQHLNADLPIKPETVELINKLAEAAYKTDMKKEETPTPTTLPSDEEIFKMATDRLKNLSMHDPKKRELTNLEKVASISSYEKGAKNMRSIASARIAEMEREKTAIRTAVADYMASEGCGCCKGANHDNHASILASLLNVELYDDLSGYNFSKYRSNS